jgi:hypothetical protein
MSFRDDTFLKSAAHQPQLLEAKQRADLGRDKARMTLLAVRAFELVAQLTKLDNPLVAKSQGKCNHKNIGAGR